MSEPRVWDLPGEPGPETTVVRDRYGCRFVRDHTHPTAWHAEYGDGRVTSGSISWAELMVYAPVTDATHEVVTR